MVCVSKSAIQCPSSTCNFAYFGSSPDPAGRLRNHFNNFKVRDAEHESYFKKPSCVFCGHVIVSKSRKGLWKSDMNKHWLINHSTEFAEQVEQDDRQEMQIALILSPSQLESLSNEWHLEYRLEEGDLITRKGRETHLSRGIVVAKITSNDDSMPVLKRRRTSYEQTDVSSSVELSQNHLAEESDPAMIRKQNLGIDTDGTHLLEAKSSDLQEKKTCAEGYSFNNKWTSSVEVPLAPIADLLPGRLSPSINDPYSADAFTAMTFCFPGFEDDILNIFEDGRSGEDGVEANVGYIT